MHMDIFGRVCYACVHVLVSICVCVGILILCLSDRTVSLCYVQFAHLQHLSIGVSAINMSAWARGIMDVYARACACTWNVYVHVDPSPCL
jgi:hypothetical protein